MDLAQYCNRFAMSPFQKNDLMWDGMNSKLPVLSMTCGWTIARVAGVEQ